MSSISVPRHFSGSAQLLGITLERRALPERGVVVFPGEAGLPRVLGEALPGAVFLYDDFGAFQADRETGDAWGGAGELVFADDPVAEGRVAPGTFDLAAVFLPKGNERIEHVFSLAGRLVAAGGTVLVVGPKKSGILSSRNLGRRYLGALLGSRSGRHAKLLTYEHSGEAPPPFDGERRYRTRAWGREVEVVSLPGVFSHGRLDDGTRFLLENLPLPEWTAALDFGCGAGVLTAALRVARPETRVDAVDASAPALDATRRTLAANGLVDTGAPEPSGGGARDHEAGSVSVFPSDGLSEVRGSYDLVISNPPFHAGHRTDFSVTHSLIDEAGRHLTPGGALVMVTNTFIDYLSPLRRAFREVEVVAETGRYRITRSRRPVPETAR